MESKYKHKYKKWKKKYLELKSDYSDSNYLQNNKNQTKNKYDNSIMEFITGDNITVKFLLEPKNNLNSYGIINNVDKSDKNKIFVINNIKTFDDFTNKYGEIDNKHLYIKWDKVGKDYKGFLLDDGLDAGDEQLFDNRFEYAIKNNNQYESWWDREYFFDDIIIF